ncbi:hypothetical protein OY671_009878, partial [Metschnikowia pulcherrima]
SKLAASEKSSDTSATKVTLPFVEEQSKAARDTSGADYWAYGVEKSLPTSEAFTRHHHAQGLSDRQEAVMTDPTTDNAALMSSKILATHQAAQGIRSFESGREDGTDLPEFSAGSHIKIQVPNGEWRKYSSCNDPSERQRYVITVKREAQGRGGSVSMVDE